MLLFHVCAYLSGWFQLYNHSFIDYSTLQFFSDVDADAECSTEPPRRKLRSTSMHGNQMGTVMESSMPPSKDALCLHVKRANYPAAIYKRALDPHPAVPSPHGHGWKINGDDISIHWMDLPPAPTSVMEFAHCSCKKKLPYTDLCKCSNCENMQSDEQCTLPENDDSDVDEYP